MLESVHLGQFAPGRHRLKTWGARVPGAHSLSFFEASYRVGLQAETPEMACGGWGNERVPHPALYQHPRLFLFLMACEETPACYHVPRKRPVVERPVLS